MSSAPRQSAARWVALGIMSSRLFGLVRTMAYSRFLGVSVFTDALHQAMKAPNLLQNLLGEQTLSAAFIPIYSRLLEEGREEDAGRFAGAVFGLMLTAVFSLVLLGMLLAPWLVAVLSPGFLDDSAKVLAGELEVDRYALQVKAVRYIFPMTGFMVLAAWAMGILNSHRKFFLPYLAPAFWNVSIVTSLVLAVYSSGFWGRATEADVDTITGWLFAVCAGALIGGLLQFLVQLPAVFRMCRGLRFSVSTKVAGVRDAFRAVGPAIAGRGVVQISLYIDGILATLLAAGAAGVIQYSAILINLPIGVFGISVAAAELPELSRADSRGAAKVIVNRIQKAIRQSTFMICPSVVGYLLFGFLVVGLIYRGGNFGVDSQWLATAVLSAYTLGLLASVISRLLQNTFFAVRDTRTPALIGIARLVVSVSIGFTTMIWLDTYSVSELTGADVSGRPLYFGACGLALGASFGAWAELFLLSIFLKRRLPELKIPVAAVAGRMGVAMAAALPSLGLWWLLQERHLYVQAIPVLGLYIVTYLGIAFVRGSDDLAMWIGRFKRKS